MTNNNGSAQMMVQAVTRSEDHEEKPLRFWMNALLSRDNVDLPLSSAIAPAILKKFENYDTIKIAGYKIPVLSDVTAVEGIFSDWLSVKISNQAGEMRSIISILSRALQEDFPEEFPDRKAANDSIYKIINGDGGAAYDGFVDRYPDEIAKIYELSNKSMSAQAQNMMLACFLIAHRVDADVKVSDILSLTRTELERIGDFWRKEINKGVEPEPPKPTKEPTETNPVKAGVIDAEAIEIDAKAVAVEGELLTCPDEPEPSKGSRG
jgi:hypothetical protein